MLTKRPAKSAGFSFAEVMFAVVILGIGFIMVAAIFPVGIQQTQATGEENIAATAARDAADSIISLPNSMPNPIYVSNPTAAQLIANPGVAVQYYPVFPPTVKNYTYPKTPQATAGFLSVPPPAILVPFNGARWQLIQSNTIVICDQRYAYVPFYRRENGSNSAELIVLAVAARTKSTYNTVNDALNKNPTTTIGGVALATYPNPASSSFTTICQDVISLNGSYVEGGCVTLPYGAASPVPAGRTYTFGRGVGNYNVPTANNGAATTFSQFELNPGDNVKLTAGTDGHWGTTGAKTDGAVNNQSAYFNSSTTLQPLVAYATFTATPNTPNGQITLFADAISNNTPLSAGPGTFVIVADDYPFDPANVATAQPYVLPPNNLLANPPFLAGSMNGRIFRLSSVVPPNPNLPPMGTVYNLDPSFAMRPTPSGGVESPDTVPSQALLTSANYSSPSSAAGYLNGAFRVKVYIVGVGIDPTTNIYAGAAQDIGVFATYFSVK